jgi:hypothetical protein
MKTAPMPRRPIVNGPTSTVGIVTEGIDRTLRARGATGLNEPSVVAPPSTQALLIGEPEVDG